MSDLSKSSGKNATLKMKLITKEQFKIMLWKNGGGTTTELYRDSEGNDFSLRISIANVDSDGPFSIFAGIRRHLMILSGNGVELRLKDSNVILKKDLVYSFSGDAEIYCSLINGPVTDFNVMINPTYGNATIGKNEYSEDYDELFLFDPDKQSLLIYDRSEKIIPPSNFISVQIKRAG